MHTVWLDDESQCPFYCDPGAVNPGEDDSDRNLELNEVGRGCYGKPIRRNAHSPTNLYLTVTGHVVRYPTGQQRQNHQ